MPITQENMIKQMQEARAAFAANTRIRQGLLAYCTNAKERYPENSDVQEILTTIIFTIQHDPMPDDRETYFNERHYSRRAKWNVKAKRTQERERRRQGIPTMEEHLARKKAQNSALRQEQLTDPYYTEMIHPGGETSHVQSYRPIVRKGQSTPRIPLETKPERPRSPNQPKTKFPREYPEDQELEFEILPEEGLKILSESTSAPLEFELEDGSISKEGVDNPFDLGDNGTSTTKGD